MLRLIYRNGNYYIQSRRWWGWKSLAKFRQSERAYAELMFSACLPGERDIVLGLTHGDGKAPARRRPGRSAG